MKQVGISGECLDHRLEIEERQRLERELRHQELWGNPRFQSALGIAIATAVLAVMFLVGWLADKFLG